MSDAAAAMIEALSRETAAAAGAPTRPVSVQLDWIGAPAVDVDADGRADVRITRVTRTLVFAEAEYVAQGRRTASAAAVFAVRAPAG